MAKAAQETALRSTVASNCILEGKGARTAVVTTDGFKDILELQRRKRFRVFAWVTMPPGTAVVAQCPRGPSRGTESG